MRNDIQVILLVDRDNHIASNGTQEVFIPEDLAHFKKKTQGQVVIMGRKTYQAIGGPLAQRTNIVMTRGQVEDRTNLYSAKDTHQVQDLLEEVAQGREVFSIGGAQAVQALLPYTNRAWLTRMETLLEGGDLKVYDFGQDPQWTLVKRTPLYNKTCPAWIEEWQKTL